MLRKTDVEKSNEEENIENIWTKWKHKITIAKYNLRDREAEVQAMNNARNTESYDDRRKIRNRFSVEYKKLNKEVEKKSTEAESLW